MQLIITRHGETIENIKRILQGQMDGTLSPNGIQQAKKLAKRLKDEKIDYIFSSDLKRAVNTTKEILKYHPEIKPIYVKELREQNLGEIQGKNRDEVNWDSDTLTTANRAKNAETLKEFFDRVSGFLDKVIKEYNDKNVLLVCHGGVSKILIASLQGKNIENLANIERIKNTSVTTFEINKDRNYKTLSFNCTKHLE
jgi:broad specificity phosphatase PhoE